MSAVDEARRLAPRFAARAAAHDRDGTFPVDAADKEFLDVDPDTGRVILSWSNFTSTEFAPGGVEMSSTFSDNLLTGNPPIWSPRSTVDGTAATLLAGAAPTEPLTSRRAP